MQLLSMGMLSITSDYKPKLVINPSPNNKNSQIYAKDLPIITADLSAWVSWMRSSDAVIKLSSNFHKTVIYQSSNRHLICLKYA